MVPWPSFGSNKLQYCKHHSNFTCLFFLALGVQTYSDSERCNNLKMRDVHVIRCVEHAHRSQHNRRKKQPTPLSHQNIHWLTASNFLFTSNNSWQTANVSHKTELNTGMKSSTCPPESKEGESSAMNFGNSRCPASLFSCAKR